MTLLKATLTPRQSLWDARAKRVCCKHISPSRAKTCRARRTSTRRTTARRRASRRSWRRCRCCSCLALQLEAPGRLCRLLPLQQRHRAQQAVEVEVEVLLLVLVPTLQGAARLFPYHLRPLPPSHQLHRLLRVACPPDTLVDPLCFQAAVAASARAVLVADLALLSAGLGRLCLRLPLLHSSCVDPQAFGFHPLQRLGRLHRHRRLRLSHRGKGTASGRLKAIGGLQHRHPSSVAPVGAPTLCCRLRSSLLPLHPSPRRLFTPVELCRRRPHQPQGRPTSAAQASKRLSVEAAAGSQRVPLSPAAREASAAAPASAAQEAAPALVLQAVDQQLA